MNYLSHYYLNRQQPSPYFKLGLLLPDLIPGFNAQMRRAVFSHKPQIEAEKQLLAGIERHYLEDRIFHNLPGFAYYNRLTKQLVLDHTQIRRRTFYLCHVAVEMMLDKILMQQKPELLDDFYHNLQQIELPVVDSYLAGLDRKHLADDLFRNFIWFTEKQFLRKYVDMKSFTVALLRVFNRATGEEFTDADFEGMMLATSKLEATHKEGLLAIYPALKEQIIAT